MVTSKQQNSIAEWPQAHKDWHHTKLAITYHAAAGHDLESATDLIHAFCCLDNETVVAIDEEPVQIHTATDQNINILFQPVPTGFKRLEQARMFLKLFDSQKVHLIASDYAWVSIPKMNQNTGLILRLGGGRLLGTKTIYLRFYGASAELLR